MNERRERYEAAMVEAAATYADVIQAIRALELPARIEQTGGMSLAVVWEGRGVDWLLTDYEDSLPWDRSLLTGWTVGRYTDRESGSPDSYEQTTDVRVEAAVELVLHAMLDYSSGSSSSS